MRAVRTKYRVARSAHIHLRFTAEEKAEIEQAAEAAGLMTSEFVRLAIKAAMKKGVKVAPAQVAQVTQ